MARRKDLVLRSRRSRRLEGRTDSIQRRLALVAVALLAALAARASLAQSDKLLNIYNWSDYIATDTVPRFEKETGIKVNYDVYDSNEVLEAKLLAGGSGYDLVVPSASPYLARQIAAGVYRKIDKTRLGNYGNLDPQILAAAAKADPGNEYGVPYLWGTTGFGYNARLVAAALGPAAPTDSLKLIFDPANAKKLAGCGISLLDSAQEIFPAALAYLGRDPLSRDPQDLQRAAAAVTAIRPFLRKFHSSQYINDLANGDLCVAFGYSGDMLQAKNRAAEAKNGVAIAYTIPKEGAMMWVDMMAIPKDAPHAENALRFIDYVLRPDIVAAISNTVAYANPNAAATAQVEVALRDDPNVYPPASVRARLFFDTPVLPQYERLRTRAWTRVKTGE
ncbi:MAG TPA: polyamine ABC transporter substrate-binding protein [Stellaceae bacterium]|nr:polyamine ABC transporter substrate-binding protein [Stellaceae bacterium]